MQLRYKGEIISALKQVIDPEIGMNIVDVGLIYGLALDENNTLIISMTLTTPGCPLTDYFLSEIESFLSELDFVEDVKIEFVFDPAWDLIMMNESAKQGMFAKM